MVKPKIVSKMMMCELWGGAALGIDDDNTWLVDRAVAGSSFFLVPVFGVMVLELCLDHTLDDYFVKMTTTTTITTIRPIVVIVVQLVIVVHDYERERKRKGKEEKERMTE